MVTTTLSRLPRRTFVLLGELDHECDLAQTKSFLINAMCGSRRVLILYSFSMIDTTDCGLNYVEWKNVGFVEGLEDGIFGWC